MGEGGTRMAVEPANAYYERLKARLKMHLLDALEVRPDGRAEVPRARIESVLRAALKTMPEETRALRLSSEQEEQLLRDIVHEVAGLGPLESLMADATISEIMINGPDELFVERDGRLERVETAFHDLGHLMAIIERLLGSAGQTVNESNPTCDASLPDGSRINVVIPPLVLNGPVVTIRRKLRNWTMEDYVQTGTFSRQAAEFLAACVQARVNIIISGGTSTAKTTLVSVLSSFIPIAERVITIENVPELELFGKRHWIRLVGRGPNLEGRGEVPLRLLVRNALRMRPDRIILGEARGGEALDVVQAMHTGHDGFITVLHANTPQAALERLETLMLMSGLDLPPAACRMQVASAIELVVHMGRFADGSRRVSAISQVKGVSQEEFIMEDLFVFEVEGFSPEGLLRGQCRYTGAKPAFASKFANNNVPLPAWVAR